MCEAFIRSLQNWIRCKPYSKFDEKHFIYNLMRNILFIGKDNSAPCCFGLVKKKNIYIYIFVLLPLTPFGSHKFVLPYNLDEPLKPKL